MKKKEIKCMKRAPYIRSSHQIGLKGSGKNNRLPSAEIQRGVWKQKYNGFVV